MNKFVELRKKIFKINNREILDQYFCEAYDDCVNGISEEKLSSWNEKIIEAYLIYGYTDDEDFPFKIQENPFYDGDD